MKSLANVRHTRRFLLAVGGIAALGALLSTVTTAHADDNVPTLWLIGDSTVKNGTKGQQGWGEVLAPYFDPAKIIVKNHAIGGRSSRTFMTEGRWDAVMKELKPGDYVVMQFGHNDSGPMDEGRARASIHSNGDETKEITIKETGKKETVHSYGWYLRQYIAGALSKGAIPIVVSPVPRNIWSADNTKVNRASGDFGKWAKEAAAQGGATFIDLNEIIATKYEGLGHDKVQPLFTEADHTHTSPAGAEISAACVVSGLKLLKGTPLVAGMTPKADTVVAAPTAVIVIAPSATKVTTR